MRRDLGRPTRGTGQQKLSAEGRKPLPHTRQATTRLEAGSAGPGVDDADSQGLIHGQQDRDPGSGSMLERVGHRLQSEEVSGSQDALGHRRQRVRANDPDGPASPVDSIHRVCQSRFQAEVGEHLGVDTAHRGAQRLEPAGNGRLRLGQKSGECGIRGNGWGELRLAELHEPDDETLLSAVVQIAFDTAALDLVGRNDLPTGGRQLGDPPGGNGLVRGPGPAGPPRREPELHAPKVPCPVHLSRQAGYRLTKRYTQHYLDSSASTIAIAPRRR